MRSVREMGMAGILIAWAVLGCAPRQPAAAGLPQISTRTVTPSSSPTPLASPTPPLDYQVKGLSLSPGAEVGTWQVTGRLVNQSRAPVAIGSFGISLFDSAGAAVGQATGHLTLPVLSSGGSSPFRTVIEAGGPPVRATVTVQEYVTSQTPVTPLQLHPRRLATTSAGDVLVLGTLTNPSSQTLSVKGLAVFTLDSHGNLASVSSAWTTLPDLAPGQSAPFSADLGDGSKPDLDALNAAGVGLAVQGQPDDSIQVASAPELMHDAQGNPILLTSIRNTGTGPMPAQVLLSLVQGNSIFAVRLYQSPIPLEPAEVRPISMTDFPSLSPSLARGEIALSELTPQAQVDPMALSSVVSVAPLDLRVVSYQQIGGALYVRTQITNTRDSAVLSPTVLGGLRATNGTLWSAGELEVADRLGPGQSGEGLLILPLPSGTDPAAGEFDLRAAGVVP